MRTYYACLWEIIWEVGEVGVIRFQFYARSEGHANSYVESLSCNNNQRWNLEVKL